MLSEANENHRETVLCEQGFIFPEILKIVPKAASNFCPDFPSLSLVDIFRCIARTFMDGFRENFQDHRRLSINFKSHTRLLENRKKHPKDGY